MKMSVSVYRPGLRGSLAAYLLEIDENQLKHSIISTDDQDPFSSFAKGLLDQDVAFSTVRDSFIEPSQKTFFQGIINVDIIEKETLNQWLPKIIQNSVCYPIAARTPRHKRCMHSSLQC